MPTSDGSTPHPAAVDRPDPGSALTPPPTRRRFLQAGAVAGTAAAVGGFALPASAGTRPAVAADHRPPPPGGGSGPSGHVVTGLAQLIADDYRVLRGQKVGVITNPTGITTDLVSEVDVMHASKKVDLVAVFGPEHGFRGTAQAGSSEGNSIDPRTGLPVYDLYGLAWTGMVPVFQKAGVDTVMFDIQDVGARFYTYIWTMYDAMTAAASLGLKFVVLDRPNPIGGVRVNGPTLEERLFTGIGKAAISQQHGMTVGELARLFTGEWIKERSGGHDLDLTVVPVRGWRRDQQAPYPGLRWVAPSPNLPTYTSAQVYVGLCYSEGTNLSQGRGTTQPFEIIGAPYIDEKWAQALTARKLPGASFRETAFVPTFNSYTNVVCRGVQTYVDDPASFDAIRVAVAMLVDLKRLYPDFAWRYDTGDSIDPYWIDKLSGDTQVRTGVDAGKDVDEIVAGWQPELRAFEKLRGRYLLYPNPPRR